AGDTALGNAGNGLTIQDDHNTIGGTTEAERNLISGNQGDGILLTGSGATNNVIENNYIGVNHAGTAAIANLSSGVELDQANGNPIGAPGAGNVISGNVSSGILLVSASNNTIQANFVGTNEPGTAAIGGQSDAGITISESSQGNTV